MSPTGNPTKAGKQPTAAAVSPTIQPNMLLANVRATSSTFEQVNFDHSISHASTYANSLFAQCDFVGSGFAFCALDGTVLENCSLRNVELRACDVSGLIINGVRVGVLMELLAGGGGAK